MVSTAAHTKMPTRSLGRNGPQVPAIGFGLMGLSAFYGSVPSIEERLKVLDKAYELGCTFWDSSNVYGDSEELIGQWFKQNPDKRKDIFLATKFGCFVGQSGGLETRSEPAYARECVEKSLKRLGTDYIDLYYCHRLDGKTPVEDTVDAMVELKNAGKVRYLGISEMSDNSLRRACAVHHIDAIQMEYSPFSLDIEHSDTPVLKTAREFGVAVIAYSPLARGMLTGRYKSPDDFGEGDVRVHFPRFSKENFNKNLEAVNAFQALANKKGCTAGQLCLAWLMAQGSDIIPIPGTKTIKYLEENCAAASVSMSKDEIADLRSMLSRADVQGDRTRDTQKFMLFVDTPARK